MAVMVGDVRFEMWNFNLVQEFVNTAGEFAPLVFKPCAPVPLPKLCQPCEGDEEKAMVAVQSLILIMWALSIASFYKHVDNRGVSRNPGNHEQPQMVVGAPVVQGIPVAGPEDPQKAVPMEGAGQGTASSSYGGGNYGGGNYGGGNYGGGDYTATNYNTGNYGGGSYPSADSQGSKAVGQPGGVQNF